MNNIKTKYRNKLSNKSVSNIILAKECVVEKGGCPKFEPSTAMRQKMKKSMYEKVVVDDEILDVDLNIF